jgi:hypothetical protein
VLISAVAPIIVYQLTKSSVDSSVTALAIGAAVPVVWPPGRLAVPREVPPPYRGDTAGDELLTCGNSIGAQKG